MALEDWVGRLAKLRRFRMLPLPPVARNGRGAPKLFRTPRTRYHTDPFCVSQRQRPAHHAFWNSVHPTPLATHIEDVAPDEIDRRLAAMMEQSPNCAGTAPE
jgi:hypothetical protein